MRKQTGRFRSLPSYAFSNYCADGDPIAEIKSRFFRGAQGAWENCNSVFQKRLTSKIVAPTMHSLTCTYVLVDKSEQAEEGARSFLLLWLV